MVVTLVHSGYNTVMVPPDGFALILITLPWWRLIHGDLLPHDGEEGASNREARQEVTLDIAANGVDKDRR